MPGREFSSEDQDSSNEQTCSETVFERDEGVQSE
jgi:hypothetical protein